MVAETSSSSLSLSSTSANEVDDSSSTEIENQTPGVRTSFTQRKSSSLEDYIAIETSLI